MLNAPVGVMLTDREGVIVSYAGDPRFAEMAYQSGLREGAVWSESEQGTNGMGTCLAMQDAVAIEGDQHFLYQNTGLTCCGAPIRDGEGRLMGVLNMSGRVRLSAAPILALVRLAVQNVENRALLQRHVHDLVVRFHPHREFIGAAGEGILAVGEDGRIKAANPAALEWLHLLDHAAVIGQSIADVLGVDAERWCDWPTHPGEAGRLPTRELGSVCFGVVQQPLGAAAAGRGRRGHAAGDSPASRPSDDLHGGMIRTDCPFCATRSGLQTSEHQILTSTLESCGWNVSAAAATLGLSRRTLHRKIRQHALHRHQPGCRPVF
ncbi:MAG: helix-turn-helix domain-containing protein [Dehalococcoidia bacterium]